MINQIAETASLSPRSIALDWKEHHLFFLDGEALRTVELPHGKSKTLVEAVSGFHVGGNHDAVVVRQGNKLLQWSETGSTEIADNVASRGVVNPLGQGCVFARQEIEGENEFWFARFGGGQPRLLAKGKISFPYWRPDGHAVLYLRDVDRHAYIASVICEVALDGSPERVISDTSQFSSFAPNGDGSVFVGASRSHGQPNVLLLLRSSRREMVLCEHRASNPQRVSPAFSPNSQRVYFQSDHEGKSSLYSVNVERLVAETEDF